MSIHVLSMKELSRCVLWFWTLSKSWALLPCFTPTPFCCGKQMQFVSICEIITVTSSLSLKTKLDFQHCFSLPSLFAHEINVVTQECSCSSGEFSLLISLVQVCLKNILAMHYKCHFCMLVLNFKMDPLGRGDVTHQTLMPNRWAKWRIDLEDKQSSL